jgi:hypothetical protein
MAWKADMTGRLYAFSIYTAWAFMLTSSRPLQKPKTSRAPASIQGSRGRPGQAGQHYGRAGQNADDGEHDARPEAVGRTTGPLHTGEGPEAQLHQAAPQRRMADAHALLDGRDVHHPGAHQGAAEDEGRHTGGSERTVHADQRNEHF